MTAGTLLAGGTPIMCLVCFIAWRQKRAWAHPPRNEGAARFRAIWQANPMFPQFGIRVGADRFIYGNQGRRLGPVAGAKAQAAPWPTVTRLKQNTGWATITFADGTVHRHLFAVRDMPLVQAELARFNALAGAVPAGQWARTKPASMRP